jgi:hypothetical protein
MFPIGVYGSIAYFTALKRSIEDILDKTIQPYILKHPKGLALCFIHCWFLLKDVPRWNDLCED